MTLDRYGHLFADELDSVADRLGLAPLLIFRRRPQEVVEMRSDLQRYAGGRRGCRTPDPRFVRPVLYR